MSSDVKIVFTGDFFPGHRINELIQAGRYNCIFNDFLPVLTESDLSVTNLESVLSNATTVINKTGPAIKALPKAIEALVFASFKLLTLANNHIMDFGKYGLSDTLALCKSHGIDVVGAGLNLKEASKIYIKKVKNKKFAYINIAENEFSTTHGKEPGANPLNPIANYYSIRQAVAEADFIFVIVHGGHEMYPLPSPRMKETYRFFADVGASAVIGHHTHCYSGYEIYNNVPIFYSLGNFIFDHPFHRYSTWNEGYAVEFIIGESLEFNLVPYTQCNEIPGLSLMTGNEKKTFEANLDRLNRIIRDDQMIENEFNAYCKKVAKLYAAFLEPHSSRYIHALQNRRFLPSLLSRRKMLLYQNLIRCETHRDVVLKVLGK